MVDAFNYHYFQLVLLSFRKIQLVVNIKQFLQFVDFLLKAHNVSIFVRYQQVYQYFYWYIFTQRQALILQVAFYFLKYYSFISVWGYCTFFDGPCIRSRTYWRLSSSCIHQARVSVHDAKFFKRPSLRLRHKPISPPSWPSRNTFCFLDIYDDILTTTITIWFTRIFPWNNP